MLVSKVNSLFFTNLKSLQQTKEINVKESENKADNNDTSFINYPKNYRPYFGERLNRTPENFYQQDFNIQNMPITVKNLLMSDYETNKTKRPMELQQEAFSYLDMCWNIQDVKDIYPDEPLFANLKTLETIRPKHGILCDLRILGAKNNTVLKSGEDLTVYLLKKIYLQGKDLSELNEDFEKDVKEDFLDKEHYPDGYFKYSTLKALGISFPENSYWHSLQATRLDKEYIPTTRTFDPTKERKPRVISKPRVSKPLNLSPEERQRRSERMIERWIDMTPAQRATQLRKMQLGQIEKMGIFFDYISPIMVLAVDKAKLSDKLIEFFRKDKDSDAEYPADLSNLTNKQSEKLKKFWDKNPYLKIQFSKAIKEMIKVFEAAKLLDNGSIEKLTEYATIVKENNALRAVQRELASDEGVKKTLISQVNEQCKAFPSSYKKNYLDYIFKSDKYNKTIKPLLSQLVYKPNDEHLVNILQSVINDLRNDYVRTHKRLTAAANVAVASTIMEFDASDSSILTANIQCLNTTIENSIYRDAILKKKPKIEAKMIEYTKGFTEDELKKQLTIFMSLMKVISDRGYTYLSDATIRKRSLKLPNIVKKLERNHDMRKNLKEFIKDYEGYIKYSLAPTTPEHIRNYIYESIIDDYIVECNM